MSVVKNKRSLSRLEFYNNARKLRNDLTNFLLRDFGVRNKVYRSVEEDNKVVTTTEQYPQWLVDYYRKSIISILNSLMTNIVAANSVYPINLDEVNYRRILQDKAIASCEQLFQELVYLSDVLPISLIKVEPYAETIDFEITLLKAWRKTTNTIARRIEVKNCK
jgi:hypothetical protein